MKKYLFLTLLALLLNSVSPRLKATVEEEEPTTFENSSMSSSVGNFNLPYTTIPGENIDPRTGDMWWETTDIVVPGPAGLDIMVSHSFAKANNGGYLLAGSWELEASNYNSYRVVG